MMYQSEPTHTSHLRDNQLIVLAVKLFEFWNTEHSLHCLKETALVLVNRQGTVHHLFNELIKT